MFLYHYHHYKGFLGAFHRSVFVLSVILYWTIVTNDTKIYEISSDIDSKIEVAVPSTVLSLILSFTFGALICFYKRTRHMHQDGKEFENEDHQESQLEILVKNLEPDLAKEVKNCWIEPSYLELEHLFGRGNFGIVWLARLQKDICALTTDVAVKKVKGQFEEKWQVENILTEDDKLKARFHKIRFEIELDRQIVSDFLKEAIVMRQFDHANILPMIGVSVHDDKPCIILPLMTNGNLQKYLQKHFSTLSVQDLLAFAVGAAKGMTYLAEQKFVHRDLAARNCMLDEKLEVKICDFGLTKDVYETDYYRADEINISLPVRWMSIEALDNGIFTTQSDVWSYGVLWWEIFSCGGHPYQNLENAEIKDYLLMGHRLRKTVFTPEYVYVIMLQCWNEEPKERPAFSDLLSELNKYLDTEQPANNGQKDSVREKDGYLPPQDSSNTDDDGYLIPVQRGITTSSHTDPNREGMEGANGGYLVPVIKHTYEEVDDVIQ